MHLHARLVTFCSVCSECLVGMQAKKFLTEAIHEGLQLLDQSDVIKELYGGFDQFLSI